MELQTLDRQPVHVAILGRSVAWAGIESLLRKEEGLQVTLCRDTAAILALDAPRPDVVLYDQAFPDLAGLEDCAGMTVIGLDVNSPTWVAYLAREESVTSIQDLARMIRAQG